MSETERAVWDAKRHVVVNAPPEEVFNYLADFTRHHEWGGLPAKLRQTSKGPVGLGTIFKGSISRRVSSGYGYSAGRETIEVQEIVRALVPNKRVAFQRKVPGGLSTPMALEIEPMEVLIVEPEIVWALMSTLKPLTPMSSTLSIKPCHQSVAAGFVKSM